MNGISAMSCGARALSALLCVNALSGCGLHLYRQDYAQLAQSAKTNYNEKIDLLGLVATERANLAKQKEAELAAVRQSQIHERDRELFEAAKLPLAERLKRLSLPRDASVTPSLDCQKPVSLSYLKRRACNLSAPTHIELTQIANAKADADRTQTRYEQIEKQRLDLKQMGWADVPATCGQLITLNGAIPSNALAKIPTDKHDLAKQNLKLANDHCQALQKAMPGAYAADVERMAQLDKDLADLGAEAKATETKINTLAARLKALAAGAPKEGDTKESIGKEAAKLRQAISGLQQLSKAIGAEEKLADLRISAMTTLLHALEGATITDEMLKQDSNEDLRRSVIVAQTVPQLLDEIQGAVNLYRTPPKSSLLIAQRQALIDKEHIAARREVLEKRRDLVLRRMAQISAEARLLSQATQQVLDHDRCLEKAGSITEDAKRKPAQAACDARISERVLLGYNFLSRSLLTARADQEATFWEDVHLGAEQQLIANEYALKSWNNLIGTPIVLLEGYHTGGIKPESLADLIVKLGGLGLLGIAVGHYTND